MLNRGCRTADAEPRHGRWRTAASVRRDFPGRVGGASRPRAAAHV